MHVPKKQRKLLGFNLTGDLGPYTIYTSRRAGSVWFDKSPPLSPPSIHQIHQRNRFRIAAMNWRALAQGTRDDWNNAASRSQLYVHGYQLWTFWILRRDRPAIATVERQSNVTLLPEGEGPTL